MSEQLRGNIEAGLRLLLKSDKPLYRRAAEVGIEDLNALYEQLEALRVASRSTVTTWRGERRLMPMAISNLDAVLEVSNPASREGNDA